MVALLLAEVGQAAEVAGATTVPMTTLIPMTQATRTTLTATSLTKMHRTVVTAIGNPNNHRRGRQPQRRWPLLRRLLGAIRRR